MARTVEKINNSVDSSEMVPAEASITQKLNLAFNQILTSKFGHSRAPKPYITPFGIKHLDTLLGGGLVSSAPVVLSSTPETGYMTGL